MDLYPSVQVEKLSGWESLPPADQAVVHALVKEVPSTAKSGIIYKTLSYAAVMCLYCK